jgi:hypothetical protein
VGATWVVRTVAVPRRGVLLELVLTIVVGQVTETLARASDDELSVGQVGLGTASTTTSGSVRT